MFLTTAEVALGVGTLTASAALGGAWLQSRRDDKRWTRERQRERERWVREDRSRWHNERLVAYSDFLAKVEEIRIHIVAVRHRSDVTLSRELIHETFNTEVRAFLLASIPTQAAISDVWNAVIDYSSGQDFGADEVEHQKHHDILMGRLVKLRNAMRRELEIDLVGPTNTQVPHNAVGLELDETSDPAG